MKAVRGVGLALMLMLMVSPALAAVPSTMSFQGLLTNNAGVPLPDGPYDLTFRIYAGASGGTALWTEAKNGVPVAGGNFAVILGSTTPLSLGFGVPYWLGITVGADPELSPRVELAASPYALSLRLPFYSPDSTLRLEEGYMTLGDPSLGANSTLVLQALDPKGGYILMSGPSGSEALTVAIGTDNSSTNSGGECYIASGTGGTGLVSIRGSVGPSHDPNMLILGTASSMEVNTAVAGNASVVLPNSAVSAAEILDEPGIAQGRVLGQVNIPTSATYLDVVTTSITIPVAGYIVVDATAEATIGGTTNQSTMYYQIDETAGGVDDPNQGRGVGMDAPPNTSVVRFTAQVCRTYFKAAGAYTFRLKARRLGTGGTPFFWNPVITAMFFPTSYGTVATVASEAEVPQFTHAARVPAPSGDGMSGGDAGILVDLRDLELRAAHASEQAERAARELTTAQLRNEHEQLLRLAQGRGRQASRAGVPKLAVPAGVK